MSRHGYQDDLAVEDQWEFIRWRGAVTSAIRGKRGQKFIRDLLAALDAMPEKRLVAEDLVRENGEVCALGALGVARGLPIEGFYPEEHEQLGQLFDIAPCLVQEVEYENDEGSFSGPKEGDGEVRYKYMRGWCERNLK